MKLQDPVEPSKPSVIPLIRRGLRTGVILFLFAFLLLILIGVTDGSILEAALHAFVGWAFFLRRNLLAFSLDPDLLLSLLAGTSLSLILLHSSLRWWTRQTDAPPWPFRASLAITAFLFILFGASFLVPGVITMLRTPMSEPLTTRSRGSDRAFHMMELRNLGRALTSNYASREYPSEPFILPADIDPILADMGMLDSRPFKRGFAASGYLYPAAGFPLFENNDFPLFISPEYRHRGNPVRTVIYNDSGFKTLTPQQVNQLLTRVATTPRPKSSTDQSTLRR